MLSRGVLASAPVRMGGAGASGTHSLASSTVFSLFFMVSFVFVSIIVIVSLRTVQHVGGGWHAQRVDDACASRAAKVASAFAACVRARCACSGPADSQPMASDASTPSMHLKASLVARACGNARVCGDTRV